MEWKLLRIDNGFEPPELSFSMHDTKEEALQTVRDHPRDGRMTNRIEGPNGAVIKHEEIAQWCEDHPAAIEQGQAPAVFPNALRSFNNAEAGKSEIAFESGTKQVDSGRLFSGLAGTEDDTATSVT